MRYYIDKIVVVEGKQDASYLSSFIEAEYIMTNGYEMPSDELDYLMAASKIDKVIVLVDPDLAGRQIENRLKEKLPDAIYLSVDLSKCNRGKKNGVAECETEEVINVLKPYFSTKKPCFASLFSEKLSKLDFLDKGFRDYLSKKFHLGKCNLKKLFPRLDRLGINAEQVLTAWEEYHGD